MTDTKSDLEGQVLEAAIGALPSPLRPYAKALVSAVPPLIVAWGVLTSGDLTAITVIQFVLAVVTTGSVYFIPALPLGKWEAGLKTVVAAVGAILSAGIAAFGGGGAEGWIGFAGAALAALLVEIVDNVPNAAQGVQIATEAAKGVAPAVFGDGSASIGSAPSKAALPTVDEIDPQG